MAKRFIDTDLFKKRFVRNLPGPYKLLWVYLFCECSNAGIWEVDLEIAGLYCGQSFNMEDLRKTLGDRLYFFDGDSKAFIPDFIEFQYGKELNRQNPAHRSVIDRLEYYNLMGVLEGGFTAPEIPAAAVAEPEPAEQEVRPARKKTRTAKKFIPPTLEEVAAYCEERGNDVNPQSWLDFYTSNGWKVGKNPMKDWKAAVRTWERNGITNSLRNGRQQQGNNAGGYDPLPGASKKGGFSGTL